MFVHNGIPFVSDIPTIIFGADVSHPPPGMYSSSIAGVRFSLLLRICFCFTTMASYREINILAHCIKNLKLNSTSLLFSPSNFFFERISPSNFVVGQYITLSNTCRWLDQSTGQKSPHIELLSLPNLKGRRL